MDNELLYWVGLAARIVVVGSLVYFWRKSIRQEREIYKLNMTITERSTSRDYWQHLAISTKEKLEEVRAEYRHLLLTGKEKK